MLKYDINGTDSREKHVSPNASALIEGLRDFGYNLETALADIIDNSISAGASNVEIITETESDDPWIAIIDDGMGMTEEELVEAMRLGSKNPKDKRTKNDLGRFGLGLKSASFSQCRKLTVLTRKTGISSCARWDLDHIAKCNEWNLELIDHVNNFADINLQTNSGTAVIWQNLDRLSGGLGQNRNKKILHVNSELVRAEYHLRLVFHKYLEGTSPHLKIKLNKRVLEAIDPMALNNTATQPGPEDHIPSNNGLVSIKGYTLPHHNKMTQDEWDEIGGPRGHLRTQGLYIYREKRLIIAGSWLGLAKQTELTKLCRIAVNIPNTMDSDWKIDVKKASAQLPPKVRDRLKKIIEKLVGNSKRTYIRTGGKLVDQSPYPIWHRIKSDNNVIFRPNIDHPVFTMFSENLPEEFRQGFVQCLKLIGSGLPIDALHAEFAGNAEAVVSDDINDEEIGKLVYILANALNKNNISKDGIISAIQCHPFLRVNWNLTSKYIDDYFTQIENGK
ncbi:MAG: ATP-binding protein [Paracoccaceae bacterium]|nr:ATP-binding protein [Paracoccaceae bacterium]MDE2673552.1 ATP-binding protein [Paracoccaceae bacterium]